MKITFTRATTSASFPPGSNVYVVCADSVVVGYAAGSSDPVTFRPNPWIAYTPTRAPIPGEFRIRADAAHACIDAYTAPRIAA